MNANEMEKRRLTKKRKVLEKVTRAELQITLLTASIQQIELLSGSLFHNEVIAILRFIESDLNLFTTRIKHVQGCRVIQESVVRRGAKKLARIQLVVRRWLTSAEAM